jgi:preprotein translocase subunit SecA
MEHLEAMDYLRSSVNLRAYGQREPIVEYKKDGLMMFKEMEETFKEQVFSLITTIQEPASPSQGSTSRTATSESSPRLDQAGQGKLQYITSQEDADTEGAQTSNSDLDIGRNDPCPCGAINPATGEVYKWKKCGMIDAPQHRKSLVN